MYSKALAIVLAALQKHLATFLYHFIGMFRKWMQHCFTKSRPRGQIYVRWCGQYNKIRNHSILYNTRHIIIHKSTKPICHHPSYRKANFSLFFLCTLVDARRLCQTNYSVIVSRTIKVLSPRTSTLHCAVISASYRTLQELFNHAAAYGNAVR